MAGVLHGGDVWSCGPRLPLDFSASLNPLGMAPEVRAAALRGVAESVHYPDPGCGALTDALCAAQPIQKEWAVWGNGAAAVLERSVAVLPRGRALLFAPCFGEYERVLTQFGWDVRCCALREEDGFDLTGAHLRALTADLDLVIFCNPNNPTGRAIDSALLRTFLDRCAALDIAALVDESFLPLTDRDRRTNLLPLLREDRRLLLLRSLTKSYCIPGLRLGYALCAHPGWTAALRSWGDPWSVSVPAQRAGTAALKRPDWPEQAVERIVPERERLTTALRELGCTVWESHTNFLLFRVPGGSDLRERLLERGILIRHCDSFRGLGADYYRIAVRNSGENTTLLNHLKEVLPWRGP